MEEIKKSMYYGEKSETFTAAKILHDNMTTFEKSLWEKLNRKQVSGLRFRRQQ